MIIPPVRHYDFEHDVVKVVLNRFGLNAHIPELRTRSKAESSRPWLSLEAFFATFPDFPMILAARYIRWSKQGFTITTAFRDFFKMSPLIDAYVDLANRHPERPEGQFGLVFYQKILGSCANGLVIHNRPINSKLPGTYMLGVSSNGDQLVIEPLKVLLEDIASEWPRIENRSQETKHSRWSFACRPTTGS